jgi:phenylacetic acid degradation operon negative regulatory protein
LVATLGEERTDVLRCLSDGHDHDRALARRCWDLPGLAAAYEEFIADHRGLIADAPRLAGAEALVHRTLLISRYRHFPFRDPQLPPELLPSPWPGDEAYRIFRRAHELLGPAARAYVGEIIGRDVIDAETVRSD